MSSYLSEDEQLESLKNWWKENGNSVLLSVAVVFAAFFGGRQWQAAHQDNSGAASELYQQLAELAISSATVDVTDEQLMQAQMVYGRLKSDFDQSIYTRYASLAMAKFLTDAGQEAQAAAELQWVLDNPKLGFMHEAEEELFKVARLRLARLKASLGEEDAALALLRGIEPGTFTSGYAEAEGDILLDKGDLEGAKAAYQRALATAEGVNPVLLQLKLQNLGVSPVGSP